MKPTWKKYLLYASLIIVGGGLIFILVETIWAKNTGFETKTLWDWMELLIIPFVLAIGAFYLNRSERAVERQIAENRIKEDRQLAEDRAKLEREIATDRQQEAALQAYLDRMADLLLHEKLRTAENEEARDVARIRTLTVLRGLDAKRKGLVILFLFEANLIRTEEPVISLEGADLDGADLFNAYLSEVNFQHSSLKGANFQYADLSRACLQYADLQGAKFAYAELRVARLQYSNLCNADLSSAMLERALFIGAKLQGARLDAAMLEGADLSLAKMQGTKLVSAYLKDAILRGAKMQDADLYDATLEGATMPDGTIHD